MLNIRYSFGKLCEAYRDDGPVVCYPHWVIGQSEYEGHNLFEQQGLEYWKIVKKLGQRSKILESVFSQQVDELGVGWFPWCVSLPSTIQYLAECVVLVR